MTNMIKNAVIHSTDGKCNIEICQSRDDKYAIVKISNKIAEKIGGDIFENFMKADSSNRAGFGLGLGIARSIIESAGGKITYYSTSELITFTINLRMA